MRIVVAIIVVSSACGFRTPADVPDADAFITPASDGAIVPTFTSFNFTVANNPRLRHDVVAEIGDTVVATVPFGTPLDALVATFVANGDVRVGMASQSSDSTPNDFTSPVVYSIATTETTLDIPVVVNLAEPVIPEFGLPVALTSATKPLEVALADIDGDGRADLVLTKEFFVSVLLSTTGPGSGQPSFGAGIDLTSGPGPRVIAVADLSRDGNADLVIGTNTDVSLHVNTTVPGAVTASFAQRVAIGSGARALAVADFNLDGIPDLATVTSTNAINVYLGTGAPGASPTFRAPVAFTTDAGPVALVARDLDGDGRPDLATANATASTISILLDTTAPGASTPSFAPRTSTAIGLAATTLTAGDANGDGRIDLLAADASGVSIVENGVTRTIATQAPPTLARLADVDGDGYEDLVVQHADQALEVRRGPTFSASSSFATGTDPIWFAVHDLDGDGKPEIVLAHRAENLVTALHNFTPWGRPLAFRARQDVTTPTTPEAVVVADFDGDGRPDVAGACSNANRVVVLRNATQLGAVTSSFVRMDVVVGALPRALVAGDFNSDGRIDLASLNHDSHNISVLANTAGGFVKTDIALGSRPSTLVAADFNNDGLPDLGVSVLGQTSILFNATPPGSTPTFVTAPAFNGTASVVADLDGDGRSDVAGAVASMVDVRLSQIVPGSQQATFGTASSFGVGQLPAAVVAADLDGDGLSDLVTPNNSSTAKSLSLLNNEIDRPADGPMFASALDVATGLSPAAVAVGDLDADGRPDLATCGDGVVAIIRNRGRAGEPLDFASSVQLGAGMIPTGLAIADFNGDGRLDIVVTSSVGSALSFFLAQ